MRIKDVKKLIVSVVVCLSAGLIGSMFTSSSIPTWYAGLKKPFFNPPNWLFAPVWTILYILMGISLYLVWSKLENKSSKYAVHIFFFHLIINIAWSFLFFELRSVLFGLIDIIFLLGIMIYLIKLFSSIDKRASNLLFPYLVWVAFATILNFSIFILN